MSNARIYYQQDCDVNKLNGKTVAIIGGGNTALQDAVLLADQCAKVTIIQNLAFCTGEKRLLEILKTKKNVEFLYNTVVEDLEGEEQLSSIMLHNLESGRQSRFKVDGIFVAIGQQPENKPFENVCKLDEQGFIIADESTLTSTPGIFAAGDCRTKKVRQVVTATGDGAVAAMNACRFVEG